jgi:hypothetical protein
LDDAGLPEIDAGPDGLTWISTSIIMPVLAKDVGLAKRPPLPLDAGRIETISVMLEITHYNRLILLVILSHPASTSNKLH